MLENEGEAKATGHRLRVDCTEATVELLVPEQTVTEEKDWHILLGVLVHHQ
jgi:hypothetical protein